MNETDAQFHDSFKPRWGPRDTIVCAKNDMTESISGVNNRWQERFTVFSEERDVAVLERTRSVLVCVRGLVSFVAFTNSSRSPRNSSISKDNNLQCNKLTLFH